MKKYLLFLLFLFFLITIPIVWYRQQRKFFQIENVVFTVWKTWGGTCYITPYKYTGITLPKKNYISGPNAGGISFYLVNDSTFVCLGTSNYMLDHPFEFNIQDYQYIFVNVDDKSPDGIEKYKKVEEKYLDKKYPCIDIDIKENYAVLLHTEGGRKVLR